MILPDAEPAAPPPGAPWRFPTREVQIGPLRIGARNPVLIQSMTIADTGDTEAVVAEIRQLVEAGCPLVRVTVPSQREAENLREIKRRLRSDGTDVPLVADVHFTPNAALIAADHVEKVRINPGNYADRKRFLVFEISDADYAAELERIRERFLPLVRRLKENGRALRIGTNHGSLSDRIMNRYGDTPEGMVESALEFARIAAGEGFHDIVFSMKSSIPSVMIAAYRLLVRKMVAEGMDYPIHVGVTEAGDGLEGRIKSAVGIGSLLASGIGDTIRVSLTEDSVHEIGAARNILEALRCEIGDTGASGAVVSPVREAVGSDHAGMECGSEPWRDLPVRSLRIRRPTRRWALGPIALGETEPPRIELAVPVVVRPEDGGSAVALDPASAELPALCRRLGDGDGPEIASVRIRGAGSGGGLDRSGSFLGALRGLVTGTLAGGPVLLEWPFPEPPGHPELDALGDSFRAIGLRVQAGPPVDVRGFRDPIGEIAGRGLGVRWRLEPGSNAETARILSRVCRESGLDRVGFVCDPGPRWLDRTRALAGALAETGDAIFLEVPASGASMPMLAGSVLCDGIGDAICLVGDHSPATPGAPPWPTGGVSWRSDPVQDAYRLLQACRVRLTRAEFIACPSCGRTQFDLQTTTARIRRRTAHLRGVKIAIMGCIVNGPGEMADADFGYVGSGKGRIDLYVGKDRVARNIPEAEAEDRLVELIGEHGRWIDPGDGRASGDE